ncbi:MAG: hypothetical protein JWQ43_2701 [Glaciihabitans sp.]|nr:hypothetical protein [Glaciihabitans sp.]
MDPTVVSLHLSTPISRPAGEVYDYACDPANLPEWAAGLGGSIERVGTRWFAESATGNVMVTIAGRNEFGVLDHYVTLPSNETIYNPMRVIPNGNECEVVFTLRRGAGVSDEDFAADEAAIVADLAKLKRLLETA